MTQYPAPSVASTREVTKQNTAGQVLLGATGVTSGTSASAGSWVQVTASTSAEYYISGIAVTSATLLSVDTTDLPLTIEIGTGGAGSEVVRAALRPVASLYGAASVYYQDHAVLRFPLRVSSGTRLAVRATKFGNPGTGNAITVRVDLECTPITATEGN